jgi:hypothetical protein
MALRRRRYKGYQPIAYPAWRLWEDRRVRTDEGVYGLLYAARIARLDLARREVDRPDVRVASDLYSDDELPFRKGFGATLVDARARWERGEMELSRMAVLLGVASLDELLGATIDLLRVMDIDRTATGTVPTGVSDKVRHLRTHGRLSIPEGTSRLYDVCVAIRNSVAHHGSRQGPLTAAWNRLGEAERDWWEVAAGQAPRLTSPSDEIDLNDHELITIMRVLDRVAIEMNEGLAVALSDSQWAWLVARELWIVSPMHAGDPIRNVGAVQRRARRLWRLDVPADVAKESLSDKAMRNDTRSEALLGRPLER